MRKHLIPFRTQQLSSSAAMVLYRQRCGRVARCQSYGLVKVNLNRPIFFAFCPSSSLLWFRKSSHSLRLSSGISKSSRLDQEQTSNPYVFGATINEITVQTDCENSLARTLFVSFVKKNFFGVTTYAFGGPITNFEKIKY